MIPIKPYDMKRLLFIPMICLGLVSLAQDQQAYQQPPAVMRDLLLAPPTPAVSIDGKGEWMLIMDRSSYPSLAELAEPEVKVAGLRINPSNYSASRSPSVNGMRLRNVASKKDMSIAGLPEPLKARNVTWSPDEKRFAFIQAGADRLDLYVVDVATQKARKVSRSPLNALMTTPFQWSGSDRLIYRTVPEGHGRMPERKAVPAGPVVQESIGRQGASRTYQDLIKSPYDEALFEHLATSQLVVNDMTTEKPIGKPAMYSMMSVSPDNAHLLVGTIEKPFSYLVPANEFPERIGVVQLASGVEWPVVTNPSSEGAPIGFDDVPDFPRSFQWRPDLPATLTYVKPLDKGMGRSKAEYRDALWQLDMLADKGPSELFKTRRRLRNVVWGDAKNAIVYENMFADRKMRMSLLDPSTGRLDSLHERSSNDSYSDIGTPVTRKNAYGRNTLYLRNGKELLLTSQGSSPEGDMPLIQSMDIKTGKRTTLWRCQAPYYENVVDVIDPEKLTVLTSRESNTETPNYFIRDLRKKADVPVQVTDFKNPYPQLEGIAKNKISYKRGDGVDLTGDLYLPKGYDAKRDGLLPVLIWAYPREYKSAADAAQVRGSKHTFTRLNWGSPIYWATQGYAVLDNAEMPIVGEGSQEPNDNFIPQLYLNAHAAIRELAVRGVGDSNRVGVGGHSYGAFMTANLLAHTKLFKAGIARSGAYNRTLTPFGFQAEERTYWQAPEVYFNMSPFSFANRIKTPILLIHGEMDNNSGTFPIQSERFYNAIKGHGGTVRYIQLPYESHGYAARENLLHMLWEQHQWLEKYVKNARKP
jgi:dipeptidyl aminopeptidase/acylaminoacyl peptidase